MVNIAVFASGGGSNAEQIIRFFENHKTIRVALIVTNVANAGVVKHAQNYDIPLEVVSRNQLNNQEYLTRLLKDNKVDYLILAGFLLMIPPFLIQHFDKKILNIHPSLLPKYGGKGMYGHHVHQAVKEAGDNITGLTIHLVDEEYDKGDILFQAKCTVEPEFDISDIAAAVLRLEHLWYPKIIDKYISAKEKGK
jgi:phosphoribosylglycinamide formyltransferase-1